MNRVGDLTHMTNPNLTDLIDRQIQAHTYDLESAIEADSNLKGSDLIMKGCRQIRRILEMDTRLKVKNLLIESSKLMTYFLRANVAS